MACLRLIDTKSMYEIPETPQRRGINYWMMKVGGWRLSLDFIKKR
jgi:hypothetical protein